MKQKGFAATPHTIRGLTLVELMVALAVGLILLSAFLYLYLGTRSTYQTGEGVARVQETGRLAMGFLAEEIRMAGYAGCASRSQTATSKTLTNITANPVVSFVGSEGGIWAGESDQRWTSGTNVDRLRGDVLTVRRASGAQIPIVTAANHATRTVTIAHNGGPMPFIRGDLIVLSDCSGAMLFRITNDPAATQIGNFPTVLSYAANGGAAGGNLATITPPSFPITSRPITIRFGERSYFIGTNAAGRPALFRTNGTNAEELVENVEDFAMTFGVDTGGTNGAGPDKYSRASEVTDWGKVVSVRISLVVVSPEVTITNVSSNYAIRDADNDGKLDIVTASDGRLRQVFSTTVALRNRMP